MKSVFGGRNYFSNHTTEIGFKTNQSYYEKFLELRLYKIYNVSVIINLQFKLKVSLYDIFLRFRKWRVNPVYF